MVNCIRLSGGLKRMRLLIDEKQYFVYLILFQSIDSGKYFLSTNVLFKRSLSMMSRQR